MVVFQLPVGILTVGHRSVGSTQSVTGTFTTPGDTTKLVITRRPPNTAAGGTLIALAICEHPCSSIKMKLLFRGANKKIDR